MLLFVLFGLRHRGFWGACVVAFLSAAPTHALVNAECFARLDFNFNPPGARAGAMGGAFISLADDATAAESNPAGLTTLLYPQLSFELKARRDTRRIDPARGGFGGGEAKNEFQDRSEFPSFMSAVWPVRRDLAIALFHHRLANYHSDLRAGSRLFSDGGLDYYLLPTTSSVSIQADDYGAALAWKPTGNFSIGGALGVTKLVFETELSRYEDPRYSDRSEELINWFGMSTEGAGKFGNVGFLWKVSRKLQCGGVVRLRPKFSDLSHIYAFYDGPFQSGGGVSSMKLPDAGGIGLALKVDDSATICADVVYNRYSQLARHGVMFYTQVDGSLPKAGDYRADDGIDFHLGGEYVILAGATPIALRAGFSYLAPSRVYYDGEDVQHRLIWGTDAGEREGAASFGGGTVIRELLGLDVSASVSKRSVDAAVSCVLMLGR